MGNIMRTTSVLMLMPALVYQITSLLMQCPGILSSQNLATGSQVKALIKQASMSVATPIAMSTQHTMCIDLSMEIRMYCIRMENLMQVRQKA